MSTITYTDIKFGFPPTDPNLYSPVAVYYNLTLDKSKPWIRADIMVNGIKRQTIAHTDLLAEQHTIKVKPVDPYPCFGIQIDGQETSYAQMYAYEATLRVYHEGQYTSEQVQAWCPRQEMTYVDK